MITLYQSTSKTIAGITFPVSMKVDDETGIVIAQYGVHSNGGVRGKKVLPVIKPTRLTATLDLSALSRSQLLKGTAETLKITKTRKYWINGTPAGGEYTYTAPDTLFSERAAGETASVVRARNIASAPDDELVAELRRRGVID